MSCQFTDTPISGIRFGYLDYQTPDEIYFGAGARVPVALAVGLLHTPQSHHSVDASDFRRGEIAHKRRPARQDRLSQNALTPPQVQYRLNTPNAEQIEDTLARLLRGTETISSVAAEPALQIGAPSEA